MQIIRGKIASAQKVVLYGPEGIGKSTFAAQFPRPLFIDTEGSTKFMDVDRTPRPTSWSMLLQQVQYVRDNPAICGTLVIDTADWAEQLCAEHVCANRAPTKGEKPINGIEDFGYGKGYTYLTEEFGRLLRLLEEVVSVGVNVCFTAHAKMRKFEQPDEMGAYDRWEMKLTKNTSPLVKEWADMVLFANYKTYVINVDNQGVQKGKNKAQGGARVIHTTHHACWDAKNRHNLPDEIPMDYAQIAHCIPVTVKHATEPVQEPDTTSPPTTKEVTPAPEAPRPTPAAPVVQKDTAQMPPLSLPGVPRALLDLMAQHSVTEAEIQQVVAEKGYYPSGTPIANYDPGFINGVLVGAWDQVHPLILLTRPPTDDEPTPF